MPPCPYKKPTSSLNSTNTNVIMVKPNSLQTGRCHPMGCPLKPSNRVQIPPGAPRKMLVKYTIRRFKKPKTLQNPTDFARLS